MKCVVVWVSAVVHRNSGILPATRERFGRHICDLINWDIGFQKYT